MTKRRHTPIPASPVRVYESLLWMPLSRHTRRVAILCWVAQLVSACVPSAKRIEWEEQHYRWGLTALETFAPDGRGDQAIASMRAFTSERIAFDGYRKIRSPVLTDDGTRYRSAVVTELNLPSGIPIATSALHNSYNANDGIMVCESEQQMSVHLDGSWAYFAGQPGASQPDSIIATVNGYRLALKRQVHELRSSEQTINADVRRALKRSVGIHHYCNTLFQREPRLPTLEQTLVGTYRMGKKNPDYPGLYHCELTLDHAKIAQLAAEAGACPRE